MIAFLVLILVPPHELLLPFLAAIAFEILIRT
jgi:hypothetical protein